MRRGVITSGTECEWYLLLTLVGYIFDTSRAIAVYKTHRDTHAYVYIFTFMHMGDRHIRYCIIYMYVFKQCIFPTHQVPIYKFLSSRNRHSLFLSVGLCNIGSAEGWHSCVATRNLSRLGGLNRKWHGNPQPLFLDIFFNHPFILFPCVFVVARGDHEKHREGWHREKKGP